MLLKCCTQYFSKFGQSSSAYRTGKGHFSFQSKRRAMPKNVQTTMQLHSFNMLASSCSKSSKPGYNSMWTKSFQTYKLYLEKSEEPEIKLPTFIGSYKKQENSRKKKIYFCFIHYPKDFDWVDHNKLWKILQEMGIPDYLTFLLTCLYAV